MCDDLIHQGLIHDPTFSRRAFGLGAAATVVLSSSVAAAQGKLVQKDVDVPMASGVSDSALFYPEGKGTWPAVLVWTDILGLRPVFREMGRRLAADLARYRLSEGSRSADKFYAATESWRIYRQASRLSRTRAALWWTQYAWNGFWLHRAARPRN